MIQKDRLKIELADTEINVDNVRGHLVSDVIKEIVLCLNLIESFCLLENSLTFYISVFSHVSIRTLMHC